MDLYRYWSQMISLRAGLICDKLGLDASDKANLVFDMGVDEKKGKLRPKGPVGILKREVVMQAAVDYLSSKGYKGTRDLCFTVFSDIDKSTSQDLKSLIQPIDGAGKLLTELKKNGCRIAIATTDKTNRAELAMEYLGFAGMMDMVVGADMVDNSKPAPDMAELILEKLNINKANAAVVGDALTDINMGINAGLKASIGVLTGLSSEIQLRELTPHVAGSVAEIAVMNG
jgi:phosphoglycolate phosphatase